VTGVVGIEYIDLALDRTYIWDTTTSTYLIQGGIVLTKATEAFTLAAAVTTKTLAQTPNATKHFFLFRNGVALTATDDYTLAGATITLVIPAFASDKFLAKYSY